MIVQQRSQTPIAQQQLQAVPQKVLYLAPPNLAPTSHAQVQKILALISSTEKKSLLMHDEICVLIRKKESKLLQISFFRELVNFIVF